jgi:hypothetical protein
MKSNTDLPTSSNSDKQSGVNTSSMTNKTVKEKQEDGKQIKRNKPS